MSIYQKPEVLESNHAYDVITFAPAANGHINLKAGDKLINNVFRYGGSSRHHQYQISSAASYALKNGQCPVRAYNTSVERNQPTHWIIPIPTVMTSHDRVKETRIKVEFGQLVNFEGRIFEITLRPNNNLGLKEIV